MNFTKNNQNGKAAAGRINAALPGVTLQFTRSRGITKTQNLRSMTKGVCHVYRDAPNLSIPLKAVFHGAENEVWSAGAPNTITAFKNPFQAVIPVKVLPIPGHQPKASEGGEAA
jgi:hypothetical protein